MIVLDRKFAQTTIAAPSVAVEAGGMSECRPGSASATVRAEGFSWTQIRLYCGHDRHSRKNTLVSPHARPPPSFLLAVEGFLLLSAWFRWFAFNQHKGWTVLIA